MDKKKAAIKDRLARGRKKRYNVNTPIGYMGGESMSGPVESMLSRNVWAVVGATTNPGKFGYKISLFLHGKGYKVYGVNPRARSIKDIPCYQDLKSLPETPDVVIFVTPPPVTAQVAGEGLELGISNFWFQPGAGDDAVLERLMQSGSRTVFNHCVMVEFKKRRGIGKTMKKILIGR